MALPWHRLPQFGCMEFLEQRTSTRSPPKKDPGCFYKELYKGLQILDEMMDNGFPLTTEPNILKEMITPPNIVNKMLNVVTGKSSTLGSKLPDAAASFVPWRRTTVKDASNEVYVNIVEELDAYVNS
ncbi:hypothetical protein ZEAMMB73_Zm00001d039203 [Zea mays]|uniref:Uncharacterized protein n=1 Tax=Zea mays TaxID=4577 RepID=A0A1D6MEF8_MAIZE|nr:hypothetical protein ZEAMMB73_Zm00001d039203 [Zea mays]